MLRLNIIRPDGGEYTLSLWAENVTLDQMAGLAAYGHTIEIISYDPTNQYLSILGS